MIGKWLLGTDLPDPNIPQNLDGQGGSAVYPTYKAIALPLFGLSGLPSVNDVNQGQIGDCVVCATTIDMVVNHPDMLGWQLVGDHEFAMIGYDSATGDFIVRNPWGVQAPGSSPNYDTRFEVSMDQIAAVDGEICVDNLGNLRSGPFSVVGALTAKQAADGQALAAIASSYTLTISGALTVAEEQSLSSSVTAKLVSTFAVADNAANISANLDTLEALASADKLTSITLTNLDIPTLTVTPAQLTGDSKALSEIAGAYWLNGSQLVLPKAGSANVAVVEINPDPALGPTNVRFVDSQGSIVGFYGDSNLNYQAFIWSGNNPNLPESVPALRRRCQCGENG